MVNPTYFFTTNGFVPHSYPAALLAGKKRLDNSASLRGQVIMWHRFLTQSDRDARSLFGSSPAPATLKFDQPPTITLATRVPEDVWGAQKKAVEMAVDEIVQQLQTLDESSHRPHVAIVALPVSLIERVWNAKVDSKATTEKDDSGGSDAPDFPETATGLNSETRNRIIFLENF